GFPGIGGAIDAGGLDVDVGEPGGGQLGAVVSFVERAGHAAHPGQDMLADLGGDFAARHDVGNGEAAAGFENAEGFGEDAILVGREVDDAVGDDNVDRGVGQ